MNVADASLTVVRGELLDHGERISGLEQRCRQIVLTASSCGSVLLDAVRLQADAAHIHRKVIGLKPALWEHRASYPSASGTVPLLVRDYFSREQEMVVSVMHDFASILEAIDAVCEERVHTPAPLGASSAGDVMLPVPRGVTAATRRRVSRAYHRASRGSRRSVDIGPDGTFSVTSRQAIARLVAAEAGILSHANVVASMALRRADAAMATSGDPERTALRSGDGGHAGRRLALSVDAPLPPRDLDLTTGQRYRPSSICCSSVGGRATGPLVPVAHEEGIRLADEALAFAKANAVKDELASLLMDESLSASGILHL